MSMQPKPYELPDSDRSIIRALGARQAEIGALPVMDDRRKMWLDLNTGTADARPPVIIETWTFDRDFLPDDLLQCKSELGRGIERQLLRNVRNHELIDDDKVIPNTYDIPWQVSIDEFGLEIERVTVKDSDGIYTAHQSIHPIKDLTRDLRILKPLTCSVDRERTYNFQHFLRELLGEFLPVNIRSTPDVRTFLTSHVIRLMGMEAFFLAMYECPEDLYNLMSYLRDNALSIMQWYEDENLLVLNNENQSSFGSSYNFTDQLPGPGFDDSHVRLSDMWLSTNSQETVGVSPEAFGEFCFPYYRDICEPMGLLYYGCCEPADPFWEYISQLPHLKKVSISRWCNEPFMGDALRGTDIVYSRKPDPNFLSVDKTLNEEAWAKHIRMTLCATRNVSLEFIIRDVYTLHGDIRNARRAVEITKREVSRTR
jgi:hypothetical protein